MRIYVLESEVVISGKLFSFYKLKETTALSCEIKLSTYSYCIKINVYLNWQKNKSYTND